MLNIPKWKIIVSLLLVVLGVLYAAPNLLPLETRERMAASVPGWVPHKAINLGLDLQGGAHLLLQVDLSSVMTERMDALLDAARSELRRAHINFRDARRSDNGITLTLTNPEKDGDRAYSTLRGLQDNAQVSVEPRTGRVAVTIDENGLADIRSQVVNQSIEIVRRRVDESGTKEPVIQRQGADRIVLQLPGENDPARIKELLGKTAKLSFHMVDVQATRPGISTRSLPMQEGGGSVIVSKRALITGDMLTDSQAAFNMNQPVVTFRFNALGARRFCEVTRENVNKPFAIVLDEKVISAPVIRDAICGGSGEISGGFTVKEAADLSLLLRAGALPAPLDVVEERTVGPSLGSDSVDAGKQASLVAMALVVAFMVLSYGLFGIFASIALVINIILIFAVMSVMQATLTLPGIAGIVLTMGMAVDANVLIYERIREELRHGRTLLSAIDKGFQLALNTIVDSQLTSLVVALMLFSFGTGPVKGFAVSMSIGIITSIFTATIVTRLMVIAWLRRVRPTRLNL
jgi:preprotein translocase subunit SecD